MFYAGNDKISQSKFLDSVEVTEEKYKELLFKMQSGHKIDLIEGKITVLSLVNKPVYKKSDGSLLEIPENATIPDGYTGEEYPGANYEWDGFSWSLNIDMAWSDVRLKRNILLLESDWAMAQDAPTNKTSWGEYRQSLRDLPDTAEHPNDIIFPEKPIS